ncbi:DDE-type integrase/transposase/recombinase [Dermacoccus barathri]|nr:DDE-type integrase/transposase/recombinase [Dermacoccus barathri]
MGYTYLHSAVDGFSRLSYTEAHDDETALTAIGFLFRARAFFTAHGITRYTRIVTDNGSCYRATVSPERSNRSRPGISGSSPTHPSTTAR